tara:strand:- start:3732 stop:3986 length:255 start_codon:yes stop_codon:yes gene_type:complete
MVKNRRDKVKVEELNRDRFKRIATKRVNKILDTLELLNNCSNRSSYSYEESEIKKMFTAIKEQLRITEAVFDEQLNKKKSKFNF